MFFMLAKALAVMMSNVPRVLFVVIFSLIIVVLLKEPMFALLPIFYLICIGSAYKLGSKIEDYAINAVYNWSIKWAIFIAFLYISAVYLNNAFVFRHTPPF